MIWQFIALAGWVLFALSVIRGSQMRTLLNEGLDKAEQDRCDTVRLPAWQVAKVAGWRSSLPVADRHVFRKENQTRHPALLPAARRAKL